MELGAGEGGEGLHASPGKGWDTRQPGHPLQSVTPPRESALSHHGSPTVTNGGGARDLTAKLLPRRI